MTLKKACMMTLNQRLKIRAEKFILLNQTDWLYNVDHWSNKNLKIL